MKVPILIPVEKSGTGNYGDTPDVSVTIIAWIKAIGDTVKKGELIVQVNEEKIDLDIASPASGKLIGVSAPQDSQFTLTSEVIEVTEDGNAFYKKVLGYIETNTENEAPKPAIEHDAHGAKPANIATPVAARMMESHGIDPALITQRDARGKIGQEQVEIYLQAKNLPAPTVTIVERNNNAGDVKATPAARALARERGVDLATAGIHGTGPDGIILPEDISAQNDLHKDPEPHVEPATTPTTNDLYEEIQIAPKQQVIAKHLVLGHEIPTAQSETECDFSDLVWFRKFYAQKFEKATGVKLQVAFPLVAALVRMLALPEFKWFNGYVATNDKSKYVFMHSKRVHMGIAFNSPRDELLILTIHNAEALSLADLARATSDLQRKSQDGTYTLDDQLGYSFIFNNIGGLQALIPADLRKRMVVRSGYSLLTNQISTIVDIGAINEQGWAAVPISFDHRAINGGHQIKFLAAAYREMIEHVIPELRELCDKA